MSFFYLYYWPKVMKIDSLRVFYYSFGPYLVIGLLIFYGISLLPVYNNDWINLLSHGCTFAVLYIIFVLITLRKSDRLFLKNVIKK